LYTVIFHQTPSQKIYRPVDPDIAEADKSHILKLIEESKQSILNEVALIKNNVPTLVTEKTLETKGDVDVKNIKTDLEKTISNRFTLELANVRRIIELSSGGGSVAQQFANGGTMNGDLTVVGSISAHQYLGIPNPDLSLYLPISGGTITNDLIISRNLSADRIFTTQLDALSANITVIDIKQYELSGFNVTGNVTIQGNISSNNIVYDVAGNSTNWNSVYTTVQANSATTWNYQGSDLKALSANWQNTYTNVQTNSANYILNGGNTVTAPLSVGTTSAQDLILETNNASRMVITSGGNVGIGTTTPYSKLHIAGSPALVNTTVEDILYLQRPFNAGVSFGQRAVFRLGRYSTESKSATRLDIGLRETPDNDTINTPPEVTIMTLRADRKVGINTTTPNEALTIVGNISATGNLSAANINTSGDIEFSDLTKGVILRSPDSSRWRVTINNNGALTTTKL